MAKSVLQADAKRQGDESPLRDVWRISNINRYCFPSNRGESDSSVLEGSIDLGRTFYNWRWRWREII